MKGVENMKTMIAYGIPPSGKYTDFETVNDARGR